jgi:hypothetical protein
MPIKNFIVKPGCSAASCEMDFTAPGMNKTKEKLFNNIKTLGMISVF